MILFLRWRRRRGSGISIKLCFLLKGASLPSNLLTSRSAVNCNWNNLFSAMDNGGDKKRNLRNYVMLLRF